MKSATIIYKKPSGAFITIESEVISEDKNYLYLACGKYLFKNIVSLKYKYTEEHESERDLKDDA